MSLRFPLVPALLGASLFCLAGCHSFRPIQPAQVGVTREWDRVWVTRPDRSTVVVSAPEVRDDTLRGFIDGTYQEMPLSDAVAMEVREGAEGRTAALVIGGLAVTGGVLVYFGNRSYVSSTAQTCSSGNTTGDVADNLPVACCKVELNTPC